MSPKGSENFHSEALVTVKGALIWQARCPELGMECDPEKSTIVNHGNAVPKIQELFAVPRSSDGQVWEEPHNSVGRSQVTLLST